jgi:hypothetical protein
MRLRTKIISATSLTGILGFGALTMGPANISRPPHAEAFLASKSKPVKYDCYGKTDDLHESSHFPLTVNVVARTICKGEQVHVLVTIERIGELFHAPTFASKSETGFGKAETNIALACKLGQTSTYRAKSKHWTTSGRTAATSNSAIITCKGKK